MTYVNRYDTKSEENIYLFICWLKEYLDNLENTLIWFLCWELDEQINTIFISIR